MPALDYTRVAAIYDAYALYDSDLAFFESVALEHDGAAVLELMAGTGRVSVPLARRGVRLVCVDSSAAMLEVLARNGAKTHPSPAIVCADVRALPLLRDFGLAILPFSGLSEITSAADRAAAFRSVAAALRCGGRFVCAQQNPAVRLRTLDGEWHGVPQVERASGGRVRLSVRGARVEGSDLVEGEQRIEIAAEGVDVVVKTRYALPSSREITAAAADAGLRLVSLWGDYDRSPYDAASSPLMVASFERVAGGRCTASSPQLLRPSAE
jgi:SAM-dependent methyltransferase